MFYEEKLINGIMYYRGSPDAQWIAMSANQLAERLATAQAEIARLQALIDFQASESPTEDYPVTIINADTGRILIELASAGEFDWWQDTYSVWREVKDISEVNTEFRDRYANRVNEIWMINL